MVKRYSHFIKNNSLARDYMCVLVKQYIEAREEDDFLGKTPIRKRYTDNGYVWKIRLVR